MRHQLRRATRDALRQTSLEWTRFHIGFFLDYYAPPTLESRVRSTAFVVDMQHKVAGIPGTGDDLMTWTHTSDVAVATAAALYLPMWKEDMCFWGDKMSWNEFLKLAEQATSKQEMSSKVLFWSADIDRQIRSLQLRMTAETSSNKDL